jgi:tRNA(Ile2) C34 agmatinyltransferase TiaS
MVKTLTEYLEAAAKLSGHPALISKATLLAIVDLGALLEEYRERSPFKTHTCPSCGVAFLSKGYQTAYCSARCRKKIEMRRYRKKKGARPRKP